MSDMTSKIIATGLIVAGALLMNGCAMRPVHHGIDLFSSDDGPPAPGAQRAKDAQLYSDLIGKLIKQDKLYAAMAHLEQREQDFGPSDKLRVLRADILRKMGRTGQAESIYTKLLDSDYAAQANHGLGLIYARNDLARGTRYLKTAVHDAPIDAQMRNDYGYALMRQGEYQAAYTQLATAFQLDKSNHLNQNNFIVLLYVLGHTGQAKRVAAAEHVSPATLDHLKRKAAGFQTGATSDDGQREPLRLGRIPSHYQLSTSAAE